MRYQLFFDESGKSDLRDAAKSEQHHLILAGVLIPWDSPFWDQASNAWTCAAELLAGNPADVELHGTDIFGGNGIWKGVAGRLLILDTIVHALRDHEIRIYWTGLPINKLRVVKTQAWKKVLLHYFSLLSARLEADLPGVPVEVYADANDWVGKDRALKHDGWQSFVDRQVLFVDSASIHGVQVADVIAHTLYRSNKTNMSNTDQQAERYRVLLSKNFVHLPQ